MKEKRKRKHSRSRLLRPALILFTICTSIILFTSLLPENGDPHVTVPPTSEPPIIDLDYIVTLFEDGGAKEREELHGLIQRGNEIYCANVIFLGSQNRMAKTTRRNWARDFVRDCRK